MDILTENYSGLRKKWSMLHGKACLSEMLKEAKVKAEKKGQGQDCEKAGDSANYKRLSDDLQGLVRLEALAMLCNTHRRSAAAAEHHRERHS